MSDTATPRLGLPYLAAAQAQKHVTLNAALAALDSMVQTAVESRRISTQPTSPLDGQMWILPVSASGADWAGNDGALARFEAGAWTIAAPQSGQVAFVRDEQRLIVYAANGWLAVPQSSASGLRNRLINGAMTIWQRGSIIPCAANQTSFTADRWQVWSAGGGVTAQRITMGLPLGLTSALGVSGAAGVTSCAVSQTLEAAMIGDLAGQVVTVSGWIYVSTPTTPSLNLYHYGVLDTSASRASAGSWGLGALAVGWNFISQTITLPTGLVRGGQVEFGMGAAPVGTSFAFTALQVEAGNVATAFEMRGPVTELALCQRYFQLTSGNYGATGGWTSANSATVMANLQTPMRTAPVCSLFNAASASMDCTGVGVSSTASVTFSSTPSNIVVVATGLSPPRTTGILAGCNTQIACSAEI